MTRRETRRTRKVSGRKGKKYPIELLRSDEVVSLIDANRRCSTGVRNRSLIAVLWRSGLRLGEALALRARDIDLSTGKINVRSGKGGRQRICGTDTMTISLIEQWLAVRKELGINSRCQLFSTLKGGQIRQEYVRQMLSRLAARAGITKRVHAHALRHSFASELVNEGLPITEIRDSLGHKHLSTTAVYLNMIAPHERVKKLHDRKWPIEEPDGSDNNGDDEIDDDAAKLVRIFAELTDEQRAALKKIL
ncbi:Tyrosine recombinase XerC [subsurface metagenome]